MTEVHVRAAEEGEYEAIIALWVDSKRVAYPYLPLEQAYTLEDNRNFFLGNIVKNCELWVAERAGKLLGFLALEGAYVDRLYIHPDHQRTGAGAALLAKARERSPDRLHLHTHQQNVEARAFYEKHGFVAVRFGVSPPPESAPDIEYAWSAEGEEG